MCMRSPIESKTQVLRLKLVSSNSLSTALKIVNYHADEVVSITMAKSTAGKIGVNVPANDDNTGIHFKENRVVIDNELLNGDVNIIYIRSYAYNDADINRKIGRYSTAKIA